MLRGCVLELSRRGWAVTVVARRHAPLSELARRGPSIYPLACDYRDEDVLSAGIRAAAMARGAFELGIAWVHSPWDVCMAVIAGMVLEGRRGARMIQVLGCEHSAPADGAAGCEKVVLGFVVEDGRSRWLSDDEIVAGVVGAIDRPAPHRIVGRVEPWHMRPSEG